MMRKASYLALSGLVYTASAIPAPVPFPDADTRYPYTGPAVPVGDWVDNTVNGNGKGFPRLVEPPAVAPASSKPSNNVNVVALSYVPGGINIHYQTPFGLGTAPEVKWGDDASDVGRTATGQTVTYDRTPPCSEVVVTQCSQFFHNVQITGLAAGQVHYYQIQAANGTTASPVMSFTTALEAGDDEEFTVAVINDMGYTNAQGTYRELNNAVNDGLTFAWHGGDLSYADDWYSGILPCESDWPVCYNGTSSELPGGVVTEEYETPLPEGEVPDQGGPRGGDMSVLYESNWDLWQQWMNNITTAVPYMVLPGNHEAACAEFDGPGNPLTAYLNDDEPDGSAAKSGLTYYSCPPSQRNFTAFQHRFRMPGDETGGVGNFWYSFDYGLAHFVSLDTETDFAYSPEWPFARDSADGAPAPSQTFVTDSGPFGAVDGGRVKENAAYAQYQWLKRDLAAVDRSKTPWVVVNTHRPMYSTQTSSYQKDVREAFQSLLLEHKVDAYFSGHIHWYERLYPLTADGEVDDDAVVDESTYRTGSGKSLVHIINGMAGNIESHSTLDEGESKADITAVLDDQHYGFSKLTFHNATAATWTFIKGADGSVGDRVVLLRDS